MKHLLIKVSCSLVFIISTNQTNAQTIHINDVVNFWKAFDKIQNEQAFDEQLKIINLDYLKPASQGLKKFVRL